MGIHGVEDSRLLLLLLLLLLTWRISTATIRPAQTLSPHSGHRASTMRRLLMDPRGSLICQEGSSVFLCSLRFLVKDTSHSSCKETALTSLLVQTQLTFE